MSKIHHTLALASLCATLLSTTSLESLAQSLPRLTASDVRVNEWGTATITVTLDRPASTIVTAQYRTQPLTATAPSDFAAVASTLRFASGESFQRILVPIQHDFANEADETFRVDFTRIVNATMSVPFSTVTIVNSDAATKRNFVALSGSAGNSTHACGINNAGGIDCWGAGAYGRLGSSTAANSSKAVPVSGFTTGATKVVTSTENTCAIVNGGAKCWGRGNKGENGDNSTSDRNTPVDVIGQNSGVIDIGIGTDHGCVLTSSGAVGCWGSNANGKLGNSTTANSLTVVPATNLQSGVTQIAVGALASCARLSNSQIRCWGQGSNGQLGNNATAATNAAPVTALYSGGLTVLSGVTSVAAGQNHFCAIMNLNGGVRCWGMNSSGQLGDSSTTQRSTAVDVLGLRFVRKLALGQAHSCALDTRGQVWCWGSGRAGATGFSDETQRLVPTLVTNLGMDNLDINAGLNFTCVLKSSGVAKCVGDPSSGRLGNNTFGFRIAAVNGNSLRTSDVTMIAMGQDHMCYIDRMGAAKCMGSNKNGQLGDGTLVPRATPTNVLGLNFASTQVALGLDHSCAVTRSGQVFCWGLNANGQLGDNSTTTRSVPVIAISSGATQVSASAYHSCAVVSGGAKCWGLNTNGRLGDGTTTQRATPVDVAGLTSGVSQIVAGSNFSCARLTNNTVRCWGDNTYGQLGNGTTLSSTTAVAVVDLNDALFLTAGRFHVCALRSNGAIGCWGRGNSGQMGNGLTTANNTTVTSPRVLGSNVTQISAGLDHVCARMSDTTMRCWGAGANGALGDNTTTNRTSPTLPSQIPSGVAAAYTGHQHSCALMDDGRVLCWGRNFGNEFNDGINTFAWTDVVQ